MKKNQSSFFVPVSDVQKRVLGPSKLALYESGWGIYQFAGLIVFTK